MGARTDLQATGTTASTPRALCRSRWALEGGVSPSLRRCAAWRPPCPRAPRCSSSSRTLTPSPYPQQRRLRALRHAAAAVRAPPAAVPRPASAAAQRARLPPPAPLRQGRHRVRPDRSRHEAKQAGQPEQARGGGGEGGGDGARDEARGDGAAAEGVRTGSAGGRRAGRDGVLLPRERRRDAPAARRGDDGGAARAGGGRGSGRRVGGAAQCKERGGEGDAGGRWGEVSRQLLHLDPSCLLYHFFYYCALYTTASQHQPTALSHAEVVRYGNTLLRLLRASMDVASCPRPDA